MAVGHFELRSIEWTPATVGAVALTLLTAGIHFALAATTGENAFAMLAVGLLVGFLVFLTDLWQPVLYLLGAVYVGVMAVVWVLAGMPQLWLGLADKVVQTALFALFVYLTVTDLYGPPIEDGA